MKKKQEKKKRGGQPLPDGQARTERIVFRTTVDEDAEVWTYALKRGWSTSRLIRESLADRGVKISRT